MATAELDAPPLVHGDTLSREEFLRRWELSPGVKKAELIGGVVYMPSPLAVDHGAMDNNVGGWLFTYKVATPGVASEQSTTTFLRADTLQPDLNLRILPEYGGKSWLEGKYLAGSPEMLAEICDSTVARDLGIKLDLYQAAGVQEYLAILLPTQEIRWHTLENGKYQLLSSGSDGIWRSRVFPGLWLDGDALLNNELRRMLARLQDGLNSSEHEAFVKELANRKAKP